MIGTAQQLCTALSLPSWPALVSEAAATGATIEAREDGIAGRVGSAWLTLDYPFNHADFTKFLRVLRRVDKRRQKEAARQFERQVATKRGIAPPGKLHPWHMRNEQERAQDARRRLGPSAAREERVKGGKDNQPNRGDCESDEDERMAGIIYEGRYSLNLPR